MVYKIIYITLLNIIIIHIIINNEVITDILCRYDMTKNLWNN